MFKGRPGGVKREAKGSKRMGYWTGRCGGMKKYAQPGKILTPGWYPGGGERGRKPLPLGGPGLDYRESEESE